MKTKKARFNINFKGTGFFIDKSVKWINFGEKPHSKIVYAKVRINKNSFGKIFFLNK